MRSTCCDMFSHDRESSASAIYKRLQNVYSVNVMPECTVIPPGKARKHSQHWKKWSTEQHFDRWSEMCCACNSWTWPKVHDWWNLGSVAKWAQYQSFPHDHTMCPSCCGLHKNVCDMCTQTVNWQECRLQIICETSMRCKKHARCNKCVRVISYFLCCFTRQISRVSHLSLMVEAVIVHETKGFSCAIRDKIMVQKNNRIAKRV